MVNKTLLPPLAHPGQTLKRLEGLHFPTWHGIRSDDWRTAGLGEPSGSEHLQGHNAWEGGSRGSIKGEI